MLASSLRKDMNSSNVEKGKMQEKVFFKEKLNSGQQIELAGMKRGFHWSASVPTTVAQIFRLLWDGLNKGQSRDLRSALHYSFQ